MAEKNRSIKVLANHIAAAGPGQPDPEKIRAAVAAAKEGKHAWATAPRRSKEKRGDKK